MLTYYLDIMSLIFAFLCDIWLDTFVVTVVAYILRNYENLFMQLPLMMTVM